MNGERIIHNNDDDSNFAMSDDADLDDWAR